MKLSYLSSRLPIEYELRGDAEISELVTDSRVKSSAGLFFCISGLHTDAHIFAPQAASNGACALVVERWLDNELPQLKVKNVREAMSYIAAAYYGYPSESLKLIGITGTKGKTTTSYMVKSILEAAGHMTGLIGTVCILIGQREYESGKTTPDPIEFQKILREMVDSGVEYVVMEVSAHALDMRRIEGVHFKAAAFTNLSQDHLDYFGDMETYFAAKARISEFTDVLLANADDSVVRDGLTNRRIEFIPVGISHDARIYARDVSFNENDTTFELCFHKIASIPVKLHLAGLFNVYNALLAAGLAFNVGVSAEAIGLGLDNLHNVPGRVELLNTNTQYKVILDYAHSPDALENILKTLRSGVSGRLIVVFGCGGERDKLKRPIMGEIAGRLADFSIVTSDNPRSEDPMSIIDSIVEGISRVTSTYTVIENRKKAILYALQTAGKGDVVVLAGKGHETYQEINGVKYPFDEKVIVHELLDEFF